MDLNQKESRYEEEAVAKKRKKGNNKLTRETGRQADGQNHMTDRKEKCGNGNMKIRLSAKQKRSIKLAEYMAVNRYHSVRYTRSIYCRLNMNAPYIEEIVVQ